VLSLSLTESPPYHRETVRIGLNDATDKSYRSSILASLLRFVPSLDHPIRPRQHIRRNRYADLFRGLQIDDELKLRRLLDGEGGLCAFQDFVHIDSGTPETFSFVG
jgi:hypothetical protein